MTQTTDGSIFEAVGGHDTFTRLVDVFYQHVDADAQLIAMYPDGHELEGAKHRLQTVRRPTPRSAATRDCGCGISTTPSISTPGTAGCAVCGRLSTM